MKSQSIFVPTKFKSSSPVTICAAPVHLCRSWHSIFCMRWSVIAFQVFCFYILAWNPGNVFRLFAIWCFLCLSCPLFSPFHVSTLCASEVFWRMPSTFQVMTLSHWGEMMLILVLTACIQNHSSKRDIVSTEHCYMLATGNFQNHCTFPHISTGKCQTWTTSKPFKIHIPVLPPLPFKNIEL